VEVAIRCFRGDILMIEGLLQPAHLLIILVVALFIFGPKKLPELGQGLGKGIRSFKESMRAVTEDSEKVETPTAARTETPKEDPESPKV
jgi:sec-independent protein translocase protein TatA